MSVNEAVLKQQQTFQSDKSLKSAPSSKKIMQNHKSIGTIYIYKNDPKQTRRGVNVSNFRHYEGGYLPLLADGNYRERKLDNTSYKYDAKCDHGLRPMHRSSFNLSQSAKNEYVTKNKKDYKGYQVNPEYLPVTAADQFQTQFDLGENSQQRHLKSHYTNHFYRKNEDQIYQLEMNNKVKVYPNRNSTIKETLVHNKDETNYWTEYNRTHNLLGAKRGPGETRNLSSRINYNVLTGEEITSSRTAAQQYHRVSGNVVLENQRVQEKNLID